MTHTSTEQPEALRLADAIDPLTRKESCDVRTMKIAADELRRLQARVQELEASQARVPLSEEAEQAAMYRWLRDHYHGFEHYRTEWAKSQGLFERDIKKQIGITEEQE